jgi:aminoglycoside phosphotransferase (APT) family kinase protein
MESFKKKSLKEYLENKLDSPVEFESILPLTGGACQENYLIDLNVSQGEFQGIHNLVFRTDKGGSLFSSLNRVDEFKIAELAYSKGVKTPKPYWLETDLSIYGSPFYFMQRIKGKANGRFLVKDTSLKKIRKDFPELLAKQLASIHNIKPEDCMDIELKNSLYRFRPKNELSLAKESVLELRNQLEERQEHQIAMFMVLNWLDKKAQPLDKEVLVHGDFRTGNFMVSEFGLEGVLDWEFAHWGDRHEDLAWLCMRDWRFGKIQLEAGGFSKKEIFIEYYEKYSNHSVDLFKLSYWEVMGNLRWAIGCLQQADRHLKGKDRGIELAAIGRRAKEMVYEAMRIIDNAG